jgi:biopolymer transport protein ExbB/TolQ
VIRKEYIVSQKSSGEIKQPSLFASGFALAAPIGLLFTILIYLMLVLIYMALQNMQVNSNAFEYIHALFIQRGPIPYILSYGFFMGLAFLIIRLPWIFREKPQIVKIWHDCEKVQVLDDAALKELWEHVRPLEQKGMLIASRIKKVLERTRTAVDGAEMDSGLHQISEFEREQVNGSHTTVRYLVWLIPTLGFIGTVLGISQAVYGFSSVIGESSEFSQVSKNLVEICRDLGVAFETTLLALVFSAILAAVMAAIDQAESNLFSRLDDLCASVLRPRLSMIINQRTRQQDADSFTGATHKSELASSHPALPIGPSGSTGTTILLQVDEDNRVNLTEASKQTIHAALDSLAKDGHTMAAALSHGGSAARLHQFLEGNLLRMESIHNWIQNDSIRRGDLEELRRSFYETSRVLAALVKSLGQQSVQTKATLDQTTQLLANLQDAGVKAHISISSSVTPQ